MAARFLALTVTLDSNQAEAKVRRLTNAFEHLDQTSEGAGRRGLRSAFDSTRLLQNEIKNLASQIPFIGRLFNALDSDVLRFASSSNKASGELKQLQSAYKIFQGVLSQVQRGKNPIASDSFTDFGIDAEKGLRSPKQAFRQFIEEFQRFPDPAGRARIAADVFGASAAKLLPTLETAGAEMTTVAASTGGVAASLAALAGPLAIVIALIAGLGIGALIAGKAIFSLGKDAATADAKLYDLSVKTSFTVETLSTLKVAAEKSGSNIEEVSQGLVRFTNNLALAATGNKKLADAFQKMGVDVKEGLRDPEVAFGKFLAKFAQLPNDTARVIYASELFGKRAGANLVATFNEVGGNLDEFKKKMADLGLVIGTDAARNADKFDDLLTELGQQFSSLKRQVGEELLPVLIDVMREVSQYLKENKDSWKEWGQGVAAVVSFVVERLKDYWALAQMMIHNPIPAYQRFIADKPGEDTYGPGGSVRGSATADIYKNFNHKTRKFELPADYELPTGGGRKRAGTEADRADRAAIKQAEIDLKAAERIYKEATAATQREYDARTLSLDDFVKRQIEAEQTLTTAKLKAIDIERAAANKLRRGTERATQLKEIGEKEAQIRSDEYLKIQQINDNAAKTEIESLRRHQEALLDRFDEYDARVIAAQNDAAQKGLMTFEAFEKSRLEIQTAGFNRRLAALAAEERALFEAVGVVYDEAGNTIAGIENAAKVNVQEYRSINDEIRQITARQVKAQDEAKRQIQEGRERDLTNLKQYANQVRDIEIENLQFAISIGNARLDRLEKFGVRPRYIKSGRQDQDVAAEDLLHRQRVAEINAAQASIDLTGKKAEQKAQIENLFRERMELEEVRHQDRLQEIRERPLIEYRQKVEKIADNIANVFGDAFDSIFEKGESFWRSLVDGFKQTFRDIAREFVQSKVKELLLSLFNPTQGMSGSQQASQGGGGQGGFSFGSLFKGLFGGGGNQGGISVGGFGGGTYNIGGGQQSGGGISGVIRNLFGGGRAPQLASGAFVPTGPGGAITNADIMNYVSSGSKSGSAGAAAGFSGAGLASFGLLAGGGFLGSLAGGKDNPAAQMIGGLGGTLLAGFAGASGLFGGGISAALPAMFSNPITAIIAGGLIGTALLVNHFSHRTEKALRKSIQDEYQVSIKDMKTLTEIKQIGESVFGKGKVRQHLAETIQLDQVKEVIAAYAESTGQRASKLVTNKELADPNNPANQFIRRINGGLIPGVTRGYDYVPILGDGGEYVVNSQTTAREGQDAFDALQAGRATIVPKPAVSLPYAAQFNQSSQSNGQKQSSGGGFSAPVFAALAGVISELNEQLAKLKAMPAGQMVAIGAEENPSAIGAAVITHGNSDAGFNEKLGRNLRLS